MDDRQRNLIINMLNGIDNSDKIREAAAEMAKTTKIMLDAFENEGIDHCDALAIIMAIYGNAVGGAQ